MERNKKKGEEGRREGTIFYRFPNRSRSDNRKEKSERGRGGSLGPSLDSPFAITATPLRCSLRVAKGGRGAGEGEEGLPKALFYPATARATYVRGITSGGTEGTQETPERHNAEVRRREGEGEEHLKRPRLRFTVTQRDFTTSAVLSVLLSGKAEKTDYGEKKK